MLNFQIPCFVFFSSRKQQNYKTKLSYDLAYVLCIEVHYRRQTNARGTTSSGGGSTGATTSRAGMLDLKTVTSYSVQLSLCVLALCMIAHLLSLNFIGI